MNSQCQSCGAFDGGNNPATPCENEGCGILICVRCRTHHKQGCDVATKHKQAGRGATVRVLLEPPNDLPPVQLLRSVPAAEPVAESPELPAPIQEGDVHPLVDPLGILNGLVISPDVVIPSLSSEPSPDAVPISTTSAPTDVTLTVAETTPTASEITPTNVPDASIGE